MGCSLQLASYFCLAIAITMLDVVNSKNATSNPCCPEDNKLVNRTCSDGNKIMLPCELRHLLNPEVDPDGAYRIAENGELIQHMYAPLPRNEYCLTDLQSYEGHSSEVAIICVYEDSTFFSLRAFCSVVTVFFLIATFAVYCLVPSLRDLQGLCIMHNMFALIIAMMNLSVLQLATLEEYGLCLFFAILCYFAFMIAFFWLNVTAFHTWRSVVYPNIMGTAKQWYRIYLIYGYGFPLFFLCLTLICHYTPGDHIKPGLGYGKCWFNGVMETWAYFYGPVSLLLLLNITMFIWCVVKLWIERATYHDLHTKSLKYKVRLYVKLFLVMGIMWIFEVLSSLFDRIHEYLDYFWVITDYVNLLQGIFIFLLLIVFRKRALRGLSIHGCLGMTFPSAWKHLEDEEILEEEKQEEGETTINGNA